MAKERTVVFVHIPKNGGTTFRRILEGMYGDSYHYCEDPRIEVLQEQIKDFSCLHIHPVLYEGKGTWPHETLFQEQNWSLLQDCNIFVMFRDPVDQALSLYFHVTQRLSQLAPEHLQAMGMRMPETFEEYFGLPDATGMQLAFLLGESQLATGKRLTPEDLERGKRLLKTLDVKVGILERYAQSLSLFEAVSGRRIPTQTVQIQNTIEDPTARGSVDERGRAFVRAINPLDEDLYQFALGLFDDQLAAWNIGSAPKFQFV